MPDVNLGCRGFNAYSHSLASRPCALLLSLRISTGKPPLRFADPMSMHHILKRLWHSAFTLLALTNLLWAGNFIVGRAVAGEVPPVALAWWRWTGAFLVAFGFAWPHLRRDWPLLLGHAPTLLVLAVTGIASFNTMTYIGLQYTTAINALLLQSVMPVVILLWAFVLYRERPGLFQTAGVAVSLVGVAAIAGHGSPGTLMSLSFNSGDVWVMGAVVIYALYAVLLRRRPRVHPLSLLVVLMGIGSMLMLPFYVFEVQAGAAIRGGWPSYAAIAYTAVLPSFAAYLFFNRGVELIGAARAGQSMHLMPVFGAVLAVIFLGEGIEAYHGFGIALIAAGIALASLRSGTAASLRDLSRRPS
jgi:drug/metabolite transporter (DMT)-like permease